MIRILFVDDQQRELDGMTRMMNWQDLGLEVAGAVTEAHAALEIVEKEKIDIVVTDIIMQDMDGLALVQRLKEKHPHIRTICISGFDDFKFVSMALNNGASGYVLKPILVNEMKTLLMRLIKELTNEKIVQPESRFDAGKLAMVCMGAQDWEAGLVEETLTRQVMIAQGRMLPSDGALAAMTMEDGSRIAVYPENISLDSETRHSTVLPLSHLREGWLQIAQNGPDGEKDAASDRNIVEIIRKNVEKHLAENVDLETLLENVYVSGSYANALFKNETGMTIHRYVIQKRLDNAARMLVDMPKAHVKDIALQCGFADASHLINSFQKYFGMTPEKYRRRHASGEKVFKVDHND